MPEYEDFHLAFLKERSDELAGHLRAAGVRFRQRVIAELDVPEYAIAVHPEDLDRAGEILAGDFKGGRSATSRG